MSADDFADFEAGYNGAKFGAQPAQTYSDDGWATVLTDVGANLKRDNEAKAPGLFAAQAQAKDLVAMADTAADAALETTFRMPLVAAGFPDAKVIVTAR